LQPKVETLDLCAPPDKSGASQSNRNAMKFRAVHNRAMERPAWVIRAEAWLGGDGRRWLRRFLIAVIAVAVSILLAFLGAAFLPRWWAHFIAHQVNGGMTAGIILGLFYGFVFTVVPLFVALRAFRKRRPWKTWLWLTILTIVLAGPNLLTLGIVIGSGKAAHAGERTLDVDAPGFRGATLAGAIVAFLTIVAVEYLVVSRRWSRRKLREARRAE
jgi:MFS family permease